MSNELPHTGFVKKVFLDRGYGFIQAGADTVFFHCSELMDGLAFTEQLVEMAVKFETVQVERGLRAKKVRPAWS